MKLYYGIRSRSCEVRESWFSGICVNELLLSNEYVMLVINNVSQQLVLFPSLQVSSNFNHLNDEINQICPLLALFGTHHVLHVSRLTA